MPRYHCATCGLTFDTDETMYLCPKCQQMQQPGQPLIGVLLVDYDYKTLAAGFNPKNPDWSKFLPVDKKYYPPYPVGNTPFTKAPQLSDDQCQVWIKNDGLNPSGSLKDRASFLMVAEANRLNQKEIVCASTGNAASSLAAVCAAAGLKAIIYVPASAPIAKRVQIKLAGAQLIEVDGSYDDAFAQSLEHTQKYGTLNRNTAYHPLTLEGKKTVALEIFAQNGYKVPDYIFVPTGDGVIITGVWKGFYDLEQAGLISTIPRLVCVQAEGSATIASYTQTGNYQDTFMVDTIADSIAVGRPSNAYLARRAIKHSGGFALTVTDTQIMDAQASLLQKTGIFAEPAAAAAFAGYTKARLALNTPANVVLLITGHGLKDIAAATANLERLN